MQRLGFGLALTLALSAPLAARAASCEAPGTCELHYADGRWTHVPNGHAIDLSRRAAAEGATETNVVVIDGAGPAPVNRVIDSVKWNRRRVDRTDVWTRAKA